MRGLRRRKPVFVISRPTRPAGWRRNPLIQQIPLPSPPYVGAGVGMTVYRVTYVPRWDCRGVSACRSDFGVRNDLPFSKIPVVLNFLFRPVCSTLMMALKNDAHTSVSSFLSINANDLTRLVKPFFFILCQKYSPLLSLSLSLDNLFFQKGVMDFGFVFIILKIFFNFVNIFCVIFRPPRLSTKFNMFY